MLGDRDALERRAHPLLLAAKLGEDGRGIARVVDPAGDDDAEDGVREEVEDLRGHQESHGGG